MIRKPHLAAVAILFISMIVFLLVLSSKIGILHPTNYLVYAANSPLIPIDNALITYWVSTRFTELSPEESSQVEKYVSLLNTTDSQSDIEKMTRIVAYLSQALDPLQGDPPCCDYSDPVQLMNSSLTGMTKVYCTHYATIYSLFANELGIPTRMVHIRVVSDDGILMHVVAESYVRSLNRWVMVDPTYGQVFYTQKKAGSIHYLNTTEVISLFSDTQFEVNKSSFEVLMNNQLFNMNRLPYVQAERVKEQSQFFSQKLKTVLLYENNGAYIWESKFDSKLALPAETAL